MISGLSGTGAENVARREPGAARDGVGAGLVRFRRNCFVRTAPRVGSAPLGVAKRGSALPRDGAEGGDGWLPVRYRGATGWVSGRDCERRP